MFYFGHFSQGLQKNKFCCNFFLGQVSDWLDYKWWQKLTWPLSRWAKKKEQNLEKILTILLFLLNFNPHKLHYWKISSLKQEHKNDNKTQIVNGRDKNSTSNKNSIYLCLYRLQLWWFHVRINVFFFIQTHVIIPK
jgi:hypothetical protein